MNRLLSPLICCMAVCFGIALAGEKAVEEFPARPPVPYLSVEDELKSFVLPEGYRMEIVLDESSIKEPVVCVFDANGRLFVCEMRTYMQDIDGTKELEPGGRVSCHESTKRDGVFDKHSVYADKMVLPRMVLALDDRVLINETDTNDIYMYKDTKGDGVSDKKDLWYAGGKRGGNLEHQQSGLIWGLDNWMYQSTNSFRLRWTGTGKEPLKENTPGNGGQWGINQDSYGKMWFSNAGGEQGLVSFQLPIIYGAISLPEQSPPDFLEVWPLVGLGDVQGGHGRHRVPDLTLNHMTASCGNEIVRVDRLPEDLRGDALICEPVGRLIRRAKVEDHEGMTFIKNVYDKKEWLLSTDPNFRPINIANGPDGCLYIVDMYRGIIQEGAWVREGSYLRKVVKQFNLDKNAGRGRIWRLVHKDFKPGPQPHMLDETPAQWVAHLEHPNGWWRDTAQKLLIVKGDKSVVPALVEMAKSNKDHLARIHALWTLEGLDALEKDHVLAALKDAHPKVRAAAIRAGEKLMLNKDNAAIVDQVKIMTADTDPNVVLQVVLTAKLLKWPDFPKISTQVMAQTKFEGVKKLGLKILQTGPSFDPKRFNKAELARLSHGETIFRELCYSCHGFDGKGMSKDAAPAGLVLTAKSTGTTIAPPLAGSASVHDRDSMLRVIMSGLNGPVAGKTYDAQMVPMNTNDDEWIADVASYVRNSFGNHGSMVHWTDSAHARLEAQDRLVPWTSEELKKLQPKTLQNLDAWKLTASHNSEAAKSAIDGNPETRWDTKGDQAPGQWFQIELPETTEIAGILLNYANSAGDFPRGYKVEISTDGKTWGKPIAEGKGEPSVTEINFNPVKTKFLRIVQTGSTKGTFWSIHELALYPPNAPHDNAANPAKKKLLAVTVALGNRSASIPAGEKALSDIGQRTGAFSVDFIKQPGARPTDKAQEEKWLEKIKKEFADKLSPENLKKYDGVIFLNTSGELPLPDKQGFIDWLKTGKAFIGIHGAADTLHEFKPYSEMLGCEYEGNAWNELVTLRIKDRKHPASATFLTKFDFTDEIYQFKKWKSDDVHTVIALDPSNDARPKKAEKPGDPEKGFFERGCREDKDYAVAWTKEFGTGRVFYTSLGQADASWKDDKFQEHLYGGIKWALGLVADDGAPKK